MRVALLCQKVRCKDNGVEQRSQSAGAPILFGSLLSGLGAYFALRFLVRYFSDPKRTLTPFAIYCLAAGLGSFIYLAVR